MNPKSKAYLVGGGIGSLAAAAFMIRDGGIPGENISIFEAASPDGRKSGRRRRPRGRLFHARRTHVDNRQLRMHLGSL